MPPPLSSTCSQDTPISAPPLTGDPGPGGDSRQSLAWEPGKRETGVLCHSLARWLCKGSFSLGPGLPSGQKEWPGKMSTMALSPQPLLSLLTWQCHEAPGAPETRNSAPPPAAWQHGDTSPGPGLALVQGPGLQEALGRPAPRTQAPTAPRQACCGCGERRARAYFAEMGLARCLGSGHERKVPMGKGTRRGPEAWPGGRNSHHFWAVSLLARKPEGRHNKAEDSKSTRGETHQVGQRPGQASQQLKATHTPGARAWTWRERFPAPSR